MVLSRWLLNVLLAMFGDPIADAPANREPVALHESTVFPSERELVTFTVRSGGAEIPGEREALGEMLERDEIPDVREALVDVPATREN